MSHINKVSKTLKANTSIPSGNTLSATGNLAETAFAETQIISPSDWVVGKVFEIITFGTFSSGIAAPSVRGRVKLGTVTIGDTGFVTNVLGLSSKQWSGKMYITVTSVGSSGTIEAQGKMEFQTSVGNCIQMPLTNTAPITIDMTTDKVLSLTGEWTAVGTNTITLRQFILKD